MIQWFDKLYKKSKDELFSELETNLIQLKKTFLITANPEIFMKIDELPKIKEEALKDYTIITPDGEGVVLGARKLGYQLWGKIAGVDTVEKLFALGDKHEKKLYVYGAKQEVLYAIEKKLKTLYPNLIISALKNGYEYNEEEIAEDMIKCQPDIILIALGVPRQENFIAHHIHQFQHGIFVGCGGSLDVLSGTKKRAPKIFIRCKMEWVYRLAKEPKRIKRFYNNNIKYLIQINKLKKKVNEE